MVLGLVALPGEFQRDWRGTLKALGKSFLNWDDCVKNGFLHCSAELAATVVVGRLVTSFFGLGRSASSADDLGAIAPSGALDDLQAAANRASANVGPGRGAVHGTYVHSSFADELAALGRADVFSEISYLNGRVVPYGTKGSVRLDAVVGSPGAPTAIYDLKTGSAALTSSRIAQIRSHLPPGFQNIPVHELRPG